MAAAVVYSLCGLTSIWVTYLLARSYRETKNRLIFWTAICFFFLILNNFMLLADYVLFVDVELTTYRIAPMVIAGGALLYGLIWESS